MEKKHKNKTLTRVAKRFLAALGLALVLMIVASPMDVCLAEDLPSYYPRDYDGTGQIHEIRARDIIIDDRLMKLAVRVRYYTPQTQWARPANFPEGTPVGYRKNSAGEITGLWLIPDINK
jgi:hypothetical protein